MRFVHAADIHLDSPPAGVARGVPVHVRHEATRRAFSALVDLALGEAVDFILIAGDLYDSEQRDFGTALFFAREMARLAPIPCVMIRGNHDAQSQITRSFQAPPNVRVLSSQRAETVLMDGVAIHGRSFPNRAVPEDFAASYPAAVPGRLNIGLLHTSLEGGDGHDTYAPCSTDTLRALGYDYWALGHIHTRRIVQARAPWIVFAGNIQGRNPRETGARGCFVVSAEGGVVTDAAFHALDVMRWATVRVALDGVEDRGVLAAMLRERLAGVADEADGRPVLARVVLEGATALHGGLLADPDGTDGECRLAAEAAGGEVHVERVVVATRPAAIAADLLALGSLEPAFRLSLAEERLAERLLDEMGRLRAALPAEVKGEVPEDRDGLGRLLDDAWALVGGAFGAVP